ncbi:flagellar hook assembly protein FlgD [Methylobrevis albus]|uniref:Basal-body rod modification protein FlgD n=1 Tax=Methylobrevis albus TaxID=2793297 RepID=A0A931HZ00_9HYPH|nr:flagellar hook capping FlgD N-terminal domain-containing protein [Methylobrevis albus]MBH0236299.1 flagellar hook assembly protein FlgD [Methylobrevis albus]
MDISTLAAAQSTSTSSSSSASSSSTSTSAASATSAISLNNNFDTFLKLLTTQIRTQNPLDPTDADKFTEQLVQFSGVEQQIKTNSNLETIMSTLATNAALGLVNYIGKTVTANSDTTLLSNGSAKWTFNLAKNAETVDVTIRNSAGAVVSTSTMSAQSGDNLLAWDGVTNAGTTAPDGSYSVSFQAKDADGKAVAVSTRVTGRVSAIDTSKAEPMLSIGATVIPLSKILAVSESGS